ncbi:hypothetical protein HH214_15420 [Mucilaginibacter robiniae]|uniref:Amino acid ABC transporter substrate-binding protein n=1 Tax=Mucilaginibacter robiniae TaxID=2728022 RepID=A0A7L5E2A4_9SPHI|nr:hypothetical protein [Mucilaginibacter robiniae]QJD97161.1 hypothetical protein HH214_15420 [Mucilaginibacter robiniae]
MTSAPNHRLPLSGSKKLLWLLALTVVGACSPKVRSVGTNRPMPQPHTVPPAPTQKQPDVPTTANKPAPKPANGKTSSIALLMPFDLDKLNSARGYSKAELREANIAIDYYQGFRLALDSLTSQGYNYRLQVFDTKDNPAAAHSLSVNPAIRNSNLIVGPVFPESIKAFEGNPLAIRKTIVSPLAPTSPAEFNNPNLVTITPPLEYHAAHTAQYISNRVRPKKVFILKSGFSEDNKYTVPFQHSLDSLSRYKIKVVSFNVTRGNLSALVPQLDKANDNIFIVPAVNQGFLVVTLRSLDTLSKHYPVSVFGHPNWEKFTFLRAEVLQRIKAHITVADRVNYHSSATVNFIKAYRKNFNSEPTAYAYKGFDEGLYFGELLAQETNELSRLDRHDYKALHNNFHFVKKPGQGWVNTHVNLLKYVNFELKQVE